MQLPETQDMRLEDIKPYDKNPRRIPKEAVEAVKQSIRDYGYVQPIIVDPEGVIVVGHTRRQALEELGYESVPVYVMDLPEEKVRQYRLVDNKTGELSEWDMNALVLELREWEEGLLSTYFPDVDLEVGQIQDAQITNEDVDQAVNKITRVTEAQTQPLVAIVCPACFREFDVKASSLPGLSYADLDELKARTKEA